MKKNITKLLIKGAQFFLFCLVLYTFYKSEFYWEGSKRSYYLKYYIILLSLFFFSFLFNFFSNNVKQYILIVSFSLLFTSYLFEGLFLIFDFNTFINQELREKKENIVKSKVDYDHRTLFEVYRERKVENDKLVSKVNPSYHLLTNSPLRPMSGISNSETLYCNENGYYVFYDSDRYGFRNLDSNWDDKIEIMVLGDSFAQGACVNDDRLISNQLDYKVINASYVGMGTLSQLATLKEYYSITDPKIVLWFYSEGNDLFNLNFELKDKILKNYLGSPKFTQNLINRQKEIDNLNFKILKKEIDRKKKQHYKVYIDALKLATLRSLLIERFFKEESEYKEISYSHNLDNFEKILLNAQSFLKANNTKLIMVYTPQIFRYMDKKNQQRMKHYLKDYQNVISIFERNNIEYLDLNKNIFSKLDDPLDYYPFRSPGHFNEKGYDIVSKEINNFLNINYGVLLK